MKGSRIALAVAAIISFANSGGAQEPTETVRVAEVQALTWAAWMALPDDAKLEGIQVHFEKSGFKSSADVLLAVQTGQIDMGPTAANVLASALASSKNLSLRMVAGAGDGTTTMIARPQAHIVDLADLKGKRLGLVRGSNEYLKTQMVLGTRGIDLNKDVQLTTLNSPTDQVLALQRGDLDAIVTFAPFGTQAERAGGVPVDKVNDILRREAGVPTIIIANSDFVAKHPKAAQAAIDAYISNWRKFDKDREFWVSSYLKSASGDRALLLDAVKNLPVQYQMNEAAMIRVTKNLASFKAIPADTSGDLVKLLDYSLLAKATGETAEQLGKQ